jgi:hypothetical protein
MTRGRLSKNARVSDDMKIVADKDMARDLCRGTSYGWADKRDFVMRRDRDKPCVRCQTPIDWTVSGNDPRGATIDHMGTQVSDVVGMTKGNARRLLHDVNHLFVGSPDSSVG